MDPRDTTTAKPKTRQVPGLRIASQREGFRRCGIAFGKKAVDLPLAKFNKRQVEQLKADPMLVVVECEVDVPVAD